MEVLNIDRSLTQFRGFCLHLLPHVSFWEDLTFVIFEKKPALTHF